MTFGKRFFLQDNTTQSMSLPKESLASNLGVNESPGNLTIASVCVSYTKQLDNCLSVRDTHRIDEKASNLFGGVHYLTVVLIAILESMFDIPSS